MSITPTDTLIDLEEAARILALAPSTVRSLAQRRRLVAIHPAGTRCVRFRRSAVEVLAGLRSVAPQVASSDNAALDSSGARTPPRNDRLGRRDQRAGPRVALLKSLRGCGPPHPNVGGILRRLRNGDDRPLKGA